MRHLYVFMCCYAKVFQVHEYQFNKDKVKTFDLRAKLTVEASGI